MEQNLPVVAKKFWKIVRVALCMLRKGISKQKIMLDIKLMMKRSKIEAAFQNLMFHFHFHHTHNGRSHSHHHVNSSNLPFSPPRDEYYEFSCSNSPNINFKKHTSPYESATEEEEDAAVMKALLEMNIKASPDNYFRGFGRQLRITDSPFPDHVEELDNHVHVDEAADQFITKFYRNLRRQSSLSAS